MIDHPVPRAFLILSLSLGLGSTACAPAGGGPTDDDDSSEPQDDDDSAVADSWDSYAVDFFATYCVSCHDSGDKDFREYQDVVDSAQTIRCGVASTPQDGCGSWPPAEQFPIGDGPFPSSEERDTLVAWIDGGMVE